MKNQNIKLIVGAVVIAIVAFYGGMRYGGNNVRAAITARSGMYGQIGATGTQTRGTRVGMMGGLVSGTVLSKDSTGITIKLRQGGSQNVLTSSTTSVQKSVDGSINDITVGQDVVVTGQTNADGSITAQSIQVRPAMPTTQSTQTAPVQ